MKYTLYIDFFSFKHLGGSNEYPQSMFWSNNKKNRYTPAYPSFAMVQRGIHTRTCFRDVLDCHVPLLHKIHACHIFHILVNLKLKVKLHLLKSC